MSLFLIQGRKLLHKSGEVAKVYPATVKVQITFAPGDAFGVQSEPRTTVGRGQVKLTYEPNEGILDVKEVLIDRIELQIQTDRLVAQVSGNILNLTFLAPSFNEAVQAVSSINQLLPPLLSLRLRTYVWIKSFEVNIGDALFDFIVERSTRRIVVTTTEDNSARVKTSISDWLASKVEHRRFFSGLYYYRQAQRHAHTQPSADPMVSEIILNLTKSLDALFNPSDRERSREQIRSRAKDWGLSLEEIEQLIIPLILLRNKFDVAHVALTPLDAQQRAIVIDFAIEALHNMEVLLSRIYDGLVSNQIILDPLADSLEKEKSKVLRSIEEYTTQSRLRRNKPITKSE